MPFTADDVWDQFILEFDLQDISQTIKYEWLDFLNQEFYRAMFTSDPNSYITTDTVTIVSGTTQYSLPADFFEIIPNHCGLFLYDSDGKERERLYEKEQGDYQDGFWINYATLKLNLTGNPTADDWTLKYIPTIATIDEGTDNLIIPERLKYKAKRIFYHALNEFYNNYLQKDTERIQVDQVYKNNYMKDFMKLFKPNVKTITWNTFEPYYRSRYSRTRFNRNN